MSTPKLAPAKILLVDDRDENLVALEALLRKDDVQILKARSGLEALELLLVHDVALALLDVQMPDMDGFELAEFMRGTERSRHVPIIFVTAGVHEAHRVFEGYDAGAVDFLFKPLDARILRHKTDVFLSLYRQRQQLVETLRLNETFVAAVGHDLRNPLNAIVMATEMIIAGAQDATSRIAAERLRASGKRMTRMIDDLFDLSRARLGQGIPVECSDMDLLAVAKHVIAEVEATSPGRSVSLAHEGDARGNWDRGRIEQVVANLLGNAVRHGKPTEPISVVVNGQNSARVSIAVHNGGSIPGELLPHLFDPFRSSNEHRARTEGLGLGLYIVHQIVAAHGGTIDVRSTAEIGTTFEVRLPRGAPPEATSNAPA